MSDSIRVCRQCHVRLAGHEPTTGCDGIEAPARLQPFELRRESCFMCGQKDAEIKRLKALSESHRINFENEVIVRRQTQVESEELRAEIERLSAALSNAQQAIARIEDDHE